MSCEVIEKGRIVERDDPGNGAHVRTVLVHVVERGVLCGPAPEERPLTRPALTSQGLRQSDLGWECF